jgi:tryptophan-rich sensory protein
MVGGTMDKNVDELIQNVVPPSWLFGIVWPILFTCIGLAWTFSGIDKISSIFIYTLLDLSLILWAPLFNKYSKRLAMYMLHVSIMFCLMAYAYGPIQSQLFITPLTTWLLLASKLNYTIALRTTRKNYDISPYHLVRHFTVQV